ncbi:serine hydrolase domain-containing protein [Ekhidna sp.]
MKKTFLCFGLIGLISITYCLFQNIIEWNFGWNDIPKQIDQEGFTGIQDSSYLAAISLAEKSARKVQKESSSPSISIAAMIDGKMVWTYAAGMQSIEDKTPADTSTLYRIGSVSKAITSMGLGKLIDDEKISLDSSIQYYTDAFIDKPKITLRQLASHQSGIRNYGVCFCFPIWEYYRNKEFSSVKESVDEFSNDPLLFKPGTDFSYSSYNYTALSFAIEKVANKSFIQYMKNDVFEVLDMKYTQPDIKESEISNRSVPYEIDRGIFKQSFSVNLSNKWAGGGLLSTPSDLVKVGNVLLDSTFLNHRTIKELTTPQVLSDGTINEQNYALGWRHGFSKRYFDGAKQIEVIHHGGMAVGGLALLIVYPEYNLVMALTMNRSGQHGRFELFEYIRPIAEIFMKEIDR